MNVLRVKHPQHREAQKPPDNSRKEITPRELLELFLIERRRGEHLLIYSVPKYSNELRKVVSDKVYRILVSNQAMEPPVFQVLFHSPMRSGQPVVSVVARVRAHEPLSPKLQFFLEKP